MDKTEIIRVICGLGNQMFSYAYGRYLEEVGIDIYYDIKGFEKNKFREFGLNYFNVRMKISDQKYTLSGNGGRWQYLKYPEMVKHYLINELTVKEKYYTKEYIHFRESIREFLSIGMHIRRGDFLKYDFNIVLDEKYFNQAYEIIHNKVGDFRCFVFSDDIDWCKMHLKYKNVVFVDIEDYLSFELLKLCDHKIISPSTFSWWASYLGGGIVIAPQDWVKGDMKDFAGNLFSSRYKTNDMIPESWLRL